ncbi:hypothetical protein [Helicobacter felis]|uniref:hypothetical protein n=1 Tax=Helicobacter felis TaxID=214 RepID=UPI000CF1A1A1|nr:hypothetical protein [Helicobacter felis]
MTFSTLSEEPLKNALRERYFKDFTCSGSWIDFEVYAPEGSLYRNIPLLWAEAKAGIYDPKKALTQLILTLLKHPQEHLAPFLGAFDSVRFSVVDTQELEPLLAKLSKKSYTSAPSNTQSAEFQEVYTLLSPLLDTHLVHYEFATQEKELKSFIQSLHSIPNLATPIDKNNFVHVYQAWVQKVKPSINLDWSKAKQVGILDADFYLADLLCEDNHTIGQLNTRLVGDHYQFDREIDPLGLFSTKSALFKDKQQAHKEFWKTYKRPPATQYQDFILRRRDLLVPPDVRERKGAFYTPPIWVAKSQEYLAHFLGVNFQEEYFIWDCAAGTGNLLAGLSEPYRIFASTLDKNDVEIIKERALKGQLDLREEHIFAFDFLKDPFELLPHPLQEILKDPKKRAKLLIYINPPYAEAGSKTQISNTGRNKSEVACSKIAETYAKELGKARNELFAQFFMRILKEIAPEAKSQPKEAPLTGESSYERLNHTNLSPKKENLMYSTRSEPLPCFLDMAGSLERDVAPFQGQVNSNKSPLKINGPILASFSTLKTLNSSNFKTFREHFKAHFLGGFMCPGNTFDNVKGSFPIGFLLWDLGEPAKSSMLCSRLRVKPIKSSDPTPVKLDVYDSRGNFVGTKSFRALEGVPSINEWVRQFRKSKEPVLAYLATDAPDFANQNKMCITNEPGKGHIIIIIIITPQNLFPLCVYFSVRRCISHSWINHNDQFYAPYDKSWQEDLEFLGDCLVFMLFSGKNRISIQQGANHFIPFTEKEVRPKGRYTHHTLLDFLAGKLEPETSALFAPTQSLLPTFGAVAKEVLNKGRELYAYYHTQETSNPNASLYDIKEFFSGRDAKGKLNPPSKATDERYKDLYASLQESLESLRAQITPKVWQYGFLRE